jgi:2',5'-phosphodiesterase
VEGIGQLLYLELVSLPLTPDMAAPSVPLVQYNVLCSSLCEPSWFRETSPADLDPATRLSRVLAKLQGHIDATHGRAIIALQEVSMSWAGALDAWFAARGYHFVATLYGNRRNDYMGIALAFPLAHYALLETDISCPATSQRWGREPRPAPPTWVQAKLDSVRATLALLFWALTLSALWLPLARWLGELLGWCKPLPSRPPRPPQSAFQMAQGRWNRLVYFRLALRGGADRGSEFGVGTYHMPCMFRNPDVMVLHAALCAQRVLSLARGAPCVLIGDFNFKPGDAAYRLITQGRLSTDDPDYPVPPEWERFSPTLSQRFTSAYVAATGAEPEYTNHCVSGMNPEVFTGTLDYIFFSPGWVAKAVTPLPPLSEVRRISVAVVGIAVLRLGCGSVLLWLRYGRSRRPRSAPMPTSLPTTCS